MRYDLADFEWRVIEPGDRGPRRLFPGLRSCPLAWIAETSGTLHPATWIATKCGVRSPRARYSAPIPARTPSRRQYPSAE